MSGKIIGTVPCVLFHNGRHMNRKRRGEVTCASHHITSRKLHTRLHSVNEQIHEYIMHSVFSGLPSRFGHWRKKKSPKSSAGNTALTIQLLFMFQNASEFMDILQLI
jgi:hypothetical protein